MPALLLGPLHLLAVLLRLALDQLLLLRAPPDPLLRLPLLRRQPLRLLGFQVLRLCGPLPGNVPHLLLANGRLAARQLLALAGLLLCHLLPVLCDTLLLRLALHGSKIALPLLLSNALLRRKSRAAADSRDLLQLGAPFLVAIEPRRGRAEMGLLPASETALGLAPDESFAGPVAMQAPFIAGIPALPGSPLAAGVVPVPLLARDVIAMIVPKRGRNPVMPFAMPGAIERLGAGEVIQRRPPLPFGPVEVDQPAGAIVNHDQPIIAIAVAVVRVARNGL